VETGSVSQNSIIIGKAGLNMFCNEACLLAAAALAFPKVEEFNVRTGTMRNTQIDGWISGQIKRGLTVVLLHRAHYQICVWAPTIPPNLFTLKIETATTHETSGNTPVRGATPKPNKRNVLAPVGLCVLKTFICDCTFSSKIPICNMSVALRR
jgi:hypothetical protein